MLAQRKFWPLMAVVSFALLMDNFIYGLVTWLADHSPNHSTSGLLHGGYVVGVLTAAPLFGYLGVRIGLKRSMICGVVLSAAATALFGMVPEWIPLFLAQLLQGAAAAATWTAGLSLVAQHHVERRVEMMGYALIGSTAGLLLGNVAGGLLGQIGGDRLLFLVAGALVAIDAGLRVFVLPSDGMRRQPFTGLSALLLDKPVLMSAAAVGLASISWGVVDTLLPARLGRAGVAPPFIGLIFVAASIVYGVCALLVEWASKRVPIGRVIAGGMLAMAIALPLLGMIQGIIATAAAVCVVSVCYAFMLDPTAAQLGNAVDRRGMTCYSAVYAVFNVAYAVGMLVIDVTSSVAGAGPDFPMVLLCASATLIFATPFLWRKT